MNKKPFFLIIFLLIISSAAFFFRLLDHPNLFQAKAQGGNLLTNGDFETKDFTGWEGGEGINEEISTDSHRGNYAFRSTGGRITQNWTVEVGKDYKISLWVKINPDTSCSGDCWGGFSAFLDNWGGPYFWGIGTLTPSNRPVGQWFKEVFSFTAIEGGGQLKIGPSGGNGWNWDILVDDVFFFEDTPGNEPPSVSVQADSVSGNIPLTVNFTSLADDPDGAIEYFFWDFGDGGRSNDQNPTHAYISNGNYQAKLVVYDDEGARASDQTTININDPNYPTISITSHSNNQTVNNETINISGVASNQVNKLSWSTDRGEAGNASGTSSWSFQVKLYGGKNRILVNGETADGKMAKKEVIIWYRPSGGLSITNIEKNSATVEQYEKFELTFDINNSVASNPYFPYEANLPEGMEAKTGITVEGIFSQDNFAHYLTQPGFIYQPFDDGGRTINRWLYPQGKAKWKIRFAPSKTGDWQYKIRVKDDSGETESSVGTFNVSPPTNPNNHGFIQVSQTDRRYFEFSDRTPFIGFGPAFGFNKYDNGYDVDDNITAIGGGGANLSRPWMSGFNIAGSSWAPWTGRIPYVGNFPGTSLTTEEAYGDGIFSFTLPQKNGTRCAFYGHQGSNHPIKPNTNYRVAVRLKTVNVTGSGGFTFRPSVGWPDSCDEFSGGPLVMPYVKGTTDWHVVTGTWNSGSENFLDFSLMTLENVTSGRVYIDEVSIREDLGGDLLGPEILTRSKFNPQNYFIQAQSYTWDYGVKRAGEEGFYLKPVVMEKDDYVFNHISPYGFGYSQGEQMQEKGASELYQRYFLRYLTARWGYARAIHSWEYVNEDAPGNLWFANQLGEYLHSIDPHQHLWTTSFWCCVDDLGWDDPQYQHLDYADSHAYAPATSWLGDTDPITGGSIVDDLALYVFGHSMDVWRHNKVGGQPIIMGEAGISDPNNTNIENPKLANDSDGVWLHKFSWAHINPGGMYHLYWYDNNIKNHNLWDRFRPFRKFMAGIPLNNGHYQEVVENTNDYRAWGQKDTVNGGAHLWIYNPGWTYTNTSGGNSTSGSITLSNMPQEVYTIEWWDTWNGTVSSSEQKSPDASGDLTLSFSNLKKDLAVKVIPPGGYPSPPPPPEFAKGDVDEDGDVDKDDALAILTNWLSSSPTPSRADVNQDGKVNGVDLGWAVRDWQI